MLTSSSPSWEEVLNEKRENERMKSTWQTWQTPQRTTHQELHSRFGYRDLVRNHVLGHKSDTSIPALRRRVVQDVVNLKPLGVRSSQFIQLRLEQDVFKPNVGVDKRYFGLVLVVLHDGTNNLQHWGDASATSDHPEVRNKSRPILELTFGALDANRLTDSEERKVSRDVALLVGLDEQLEVTSVIVGGDRRIGAHDVLAVYLSLNRDVLSNRKAKEVVGVGKRELVATWA